MSQDFYFPHTGEVLSFPVAAGWRPRFATTRDMLMRFAESVATDDVRVELIGFVDREFPGAEVVA